MMTQAAGLVYEDGERTLTMKDGVLKATAKSDGRQFAAYVGGRAETTDRLPPGTDAAIRARGKDPGGWFAVVVDGTPRMVLPPDARAAVDAAIQDARRQEDSPAVRERREVARLAERADSLHDNPGAYFPAQHRAEQALAAWRAKYPAEAAAEDGEGLRQQAADLREKAKRALLYDADGSLSREDQQRRHDELMARADELERRARR